MRPQGGRPVPGQPIFQRPRPRGGPGGSEGLVRHSVRASVVRCIRRVRLRPAHVRWAVAALAPAAASGRRPAGSVQAPSRRPGQRYVPRGVKEGPMKGFVPPPRMVVFERAAADHADDHDHRRHQRQRPGGEAGRSREGRDCAPAGARCFCHHQPDARRRTGEGHGEAVRRRHQRYHLREQAEKDMASKGVLKKLRRRWYRVRRWSPSWATSITARPACSTRSATRCSRGRGWRNHAAHRRIQGNDH